MHLLDVRVRPCAYVKEVIEGSWKNLQEGAEKGFGHTLYGFKVLIVPEGIAVKAYINQSINPRLFQTEVHS